jgi:hypothetical protein
MHSAAVGISGKRRYFNNPIFPFEFKRKLGARWSRTASAAHRSKLYRKGNAIRDSPPRSTAMSARFLLPAALVLAAAPLLAQAADGDAAVTAKVKSAIDRAPGLSGLPIRVSTVGGVVRLSGDVPGGIQVDEAQDVASRVPGVREINNQLHPARDS